MNIRILLFAMCLSVATCYTQDSETQENEDLQVTPISEQLTLSNAGKALGSLWLYTQISRAYVYSIISQNYQACLSHIHISQFDTDNTEEYQHAQEITKILEHIVETDTEHNFSVKLLTPYNTDELYEHLIHADNSTIWVLYDRTNTLTPNNPAVTLSNNIIVIQPRFLEQTYQQKYAMLCHEYTHIIKSHVTNARTALAYFLVTILWLTQDNTNTPSTNWKYIPLINLCEKIEQIEMKRYHEIQTDLASAQEYQAMYNALDYLYGSNENFPFSQLSPQEKAGRIITWLTGTHETNTNRYAYMKHYAEYGTLPWWLKIRPAYWLGGTLSQLESMLEVFDIPTNYIIDGITWTYKQLPQSKSDDTQNEQVRASA